MAVFCLTFKRGFTVYKDVGIVTITTVAAVNGIPARVYSSNPNVSTNRAALLREVKGFAQGHTGQGRGHLASETGLAL